MNSWKKLFIALIMLNIIVVVGVIFLIFLPTKDEEIALNDINQDDYVQFHVQSNKADLNRLINHYIKEQGLNERIKYNVTLTDQVELYGTMKVFTQDVELKLTFEPESLDNGDLILRQKTISIGHLQLPVPVVLKFIRDSYDIPSWITIRPNDEEMYVNLHDLKLKSDTKVRVNTFDLKRDNIVFTLLVPIK
ncbi:YpmS family protein [Robertmurraya korlensis]|uniref:YpmS family protein n=1 Tax=Robertmurraya korlensis TaxID=519977 RepID=UPI0027B8EDDA|nr:YpmS family protein [Robertmurraya korlensis]